MTLANVMVGVYTPASALREQANKLAHDLHLHYYNDLPAPGTVEFLLQLREHEPTPVLEILEYTAMAPGPIVVDFIGGKLGYRRRHNLGRQQPLARAIGCKGTPLPSVLDATPGLGRDAFVLACLGCPVTLVERSPIMAALLENGIRRAQDKAETRALVANMHLILADSAGYLSQLHGAACPDVIYLDPMYPHRSKSALVKKEMRILRRLVGDDTDAPQLLAIALTCARRRVVVKRPRLAPPLTSKTPPTMHIESKNTRYDVYIIPRRP